MRAARLLRMLLILQNRGRQTTAQLAEELEVAPRTILRDVDAMTEAGLPIIVFQGNQGGIELGFQYRTRLTGLSEQEATALGLILSARNPMITALGLDTEADMARTKLVESFPDRTRGYVERSMDRFRLVGTDPYDDPRIAALAGAIQRQTVVRLRFCSPGEQLIHPTQMELSDGQWKIRDALSGDWIKRSDWGRVNVSRKPFARR